MSEPVDRRTFLGRMTLTAGAVFVGRFMPAPFASAASNAVGASSEVAGAAVAAPAGDWHVDDMWGHWPRYAHPIPYARAQAAPVDWDNVDPVDRAFLM